MNSYIDPYQWQRR